LAAILSPDAPDSATGRAHLSQTLTYLRQVLEPNGTPRGTILLTDTNYVRVAPGVLACDVREIEDALETALRATGEPGDSALRNARSLYVGDFLPGFYGDWVIDERNRLAARFAEVEARLKRLEATRPTLSPAVVRLPHLLTECIGRVEEHQHLKARLSEDDHSRLVTITGSGGFGKTRLALEVAHDLVRTGPFHDIVFVPLAEVRHADQVPRSIADAFRMMDGKQDPLALMATFLQARARRGLRTLIVLDNLEQLGEAAPMVRELLQSTTAITVLATSRHRIGVDGEQEFPLSPLAGVASAPSASFSLTELASCSDVRLFTDRARLVRPGFAVTAANSKSVATVCRLLEGVPLALELAAAWVRLLPPAQIAARLSRRFDLLVRRNDKGSDGTGRHHSLWSTLQWSFDLLAPSLQNFLAALSIFQGGFTLEAANAVTCVGDPVEPLALLAERSLLIVEEDDSGSTRFRLLESLREFAAEHLPPETRTLLIERHVTYFYGELAGLVEDSDATRFFSVLKREYANLAQAVTYAVERSDGTRALKLANLIWAHLDSGVPLGVSVSRLEETLRQCEPLAAPPEIRLSCLLALGKAALFQGRIGIAHAASEAALKLAHETESEEREMDALSLLASSLRLSGNGDAALTRYRALHEARTRRGEDRQAIGVMSGIVVLLHSRDPDEAERLYPPLVERARQFDPTFVSSILCNWACLRIEREEFAEIDSLLDAAQEAHVFRNPSGEYGSMEAYIDSIRSYCALRQGDREGVRRFATRSLRGFVRTGEDRRQWQVILHIACAQEDMGAVVGTRLLGAILTAMEKAGVGADTHDAAETERARTRFQSLLGRETFHREWESGAGWDLEQAVSAALEAAR
jgi:predicted ATPase